MIRICSLKMASFPAETARKKEVRWHATEECPRGMLHQKVCLPRVCPKLGLCHRKITEPAILRWKRDGKISIAPGARFRCWHIPLKSEALLRSFIICNERREKKQDALHYVAFQELPLKEHWWESLTLVGIPEFPKFTTWISLA